MPFVFVTVFPKLKMLVKKLQRGLLKLFAGFPDKCCRNG